MSGTQLSVFVFDSPRTCSQLFNKLMASHAQLTNILHPLIGASMYGPENVGQYLKKCEAALEAQDELAAASGLDNETYTGAVDGLLSQDAEIRAQGKVPWIKDHAFCITKPDVVADYIHNISNQAAHIQNPTVLPDSFFFSPVLTPIILIRHPASILPSYLRVQKPVFKLKINDEYLRAMISLHWARLIFDAYRAKGHTPIVVDAADLLHDPVRIMTSVCRRLDLDPRGVQYKWNAVSKEDWPTDPIMQGFFGDLLKSKGAERRGNGRPQAMGMEARLRAWEKEFGVGVAVKIEQIVEREMKDYDYLQAFRLQVPDRGADRVVRDA